MLFYEKCSYGAHIEQSTDCIWLINSLDWSREPFFTWNYFKLFNSFNKGFIEIVINLIQELLKQKIKTVI